MRVLRFLLRKEFLQIFRDRIMLRQLFLMPMVQLLVLSSAATFEVRSSRLWVVDLDRTSTSRGMLTRLTASGRFEPVGASTGMAPADAAMRTRDADAIIRIPAGFERDLVRARRADVQLVLNAEDGAQAGVTASYAREILAGYSRELGAERTPSVAARGAAPAPAIAVTRRGWYNAELAYRDYMIPGILVMLVTLVGTLLTAMNIVREKESGTLEQLNVTPIGRGTFIAAKLIPLWVIAILELTLGLLIARFVFDVPMRGSIPLVYAAAGVYLTAALGIGLFISTLVETQQQAMFVTFFLVMIYLLMSGLFTPLASMPDWAQALAHLNPLMYFTRLMRGVLLRGAGVAEVWRDVVVLAAFGAVVLGMAVMHHGKRVA